MAASKFRLALIQLAVTADKPGNISRAVEKVAEAAARGAQVVSLPECFNSPYGTSHFPEYAEDVPDGPTCRALKKAAADNKVVLKVYLVGGSLPERVVNSSEGGERLYNTCTVWSPEGELIGKFRKLHLFDIDIPGKITFKESDALSSGDEFLTFRTPFCNVGVGICYDIRFAEVAQIYAQQNACRLLLYPGAFNMTTGPVHWELLAKARALDNQVYVATVSPARDETAGYVAWGHSTVVDPYGDIVAKAGHGDEVIYADVDLEKLEAIRKQIPITFQRRTDLYSVKKLG